MLIGEILLIGFWDCGDDWYVIINVNISLDNDGIVMNQHHDCQNNKTIDVNMIDGSSS